MLEVWSDSEDLVDQVLHANNAVLAQVGLDDRVVGESNALLVDLSISTLVDELADGLKVRVSVGNPWLDDLQHLKCGLGHANEDTVVDLEKTKELENLSGLWCDLVNTRLLWKVLDQRQQSNVHLPFDPDHEDQLLHSSRNVESTILLSQASKGGSSRALDHGTP